MSHQSSDIHLAIESATSCLSASSLSTSSSKCLKPPTKIKRLFNDRLRNFRLNFAPKKFNKEAFDKLIITNEQQEQQHFDIVNQEDNTEPLSHHKSESNLTSLSAEHTNQNQNGCWETEDSNTLFTLTQHPQKLSEDRTDEYCLPLLNSCKHHDLASINSSTLVDLISGKYKQHVSKDIIVDARYPYEYVGGHIVSACNICDEETLFSEMFANVNLTKKPPVIIFHCEFSSKRAPNLMRTMRKLDRRLNAENYPSLHYPEMYLLEGGYKDFYERYIEFCEPKGYVPMLHTDHEHDLKARRRTVAELQCRRPTKLVIRTRLCFS